MLRSLVGSEMCIRDRYFILLVKRSKAYTIRPKIIIPPKSKYTAVHGNLSLECVATSSVAEPIFINWFHNDELVTNTKLISSSKLQRIRTNLLKKTSTLVLNKVRYEAKGRYSCDAVNIYGSVKSSHANVTIVGMFNINFF